MTAQPGKRERRDIDPRKGRGAGAERVHNRRANDRSVGDGQRRAFTRQRLREPGAHALDQSRDQLAAMRRGCGIAEPGRERVRLALSDILRGEAAPAPIVAVAQRHLDFGVETQRLSRLARRARRRGQHLSIGAQPAAQGLERADGGGFKRFVVGKAGRARRRGRAMREQVEARRHGRARAPRLSRPSAAGRPSPRRNRVRPRRRSRARAPST